MNARFDGHVVMGFEGSNSLVGRMNARFHSDVVRVFFEGANSMVDRMNARFDLHVGGGF